MPILRGMATVLLLQTLYKPQHRMTKIVTLIAFVGTLGVAMEASAQTVTPRLGTPPFARDGLSRETAPTLYDAPDVQRPVGFESQDRRGLDRFHLLAAAELGAGPGRFHDWSYGLSQ